MEAYDYCDKLKAALIRERTVVEISLKFKDLSNNAAKVRLCLELMKARNLLPSPMNEVKDATIALMARNKGNEYFIKQKDYVAALEWYNRSLCFSADDERGRVNQSICYANRSAIYLKTNFFEFCLQNIELAMNLGYPEKLVPKLLKRKEECLNLINNQVDRQTEYSEEQVKLSYQPNPKIPGIIDGIALAKDDEFGRYLVATRNLKPGDILVLEEPYSSVLQKDSVYSFCTHCKKANHLNLKPSPNSTVAMFCSQACEQESWDRYFKYESQVISGLYDLFTKIVLISIRTTFMAFTLFDTVDALRQFITSIDMENTNAMELDYTVATEQDHLRNVYALASNEKLRNVADLFQRAGLIAVAFDMLTKQTSIKNLLKTESDEDLFIEMLFHLNQVAASNFHTMNYMTRSKGLETAFALYSSKTNASGSFPICSLINHSCAPNVVRLNDKQNIVLTIRPIKRGDQLFDSYGAHHCLESYEERKQILLSQYNFECQCEACKQRFPLYDELKAMNLNMMDVFQVLEELDPAKKYDPIVAKRAFEIFNSFLLKNDKQYPCYDISTVQEKQLICARILYSSVPLELQFAANDLVK